MKTNNEIVGTNNNGKMISYKRGVPTAFLLSDCLFVMLICFIMMIGCFFFGHETGFLHGQDYQKKQQGYKFQNARSAFAEAK